MSWKFNPFTGKFDYYEATGAAVGLFEIDVNGGLEPVTAVQSDDYFELDASGNIQPKLA